MKAHYLSLALAVTISSCQPKNKQNAEATASSTTVAEDSAATLKKRPNSDTPRSAADRLVRALYFEHNAKENPFREKNDRSLVDQFFAKPTADLIWDDALKSTGKINRIKTNLLFNAADATIKKTWVLPAMVGGSRAFVYVTFEKNGNPEELKIDMTRTAGRWRIVEMYYPNGKRLTQLL